MISLHLIDETAHNTCYSVRLSVLDFPLMLHNYFTVRSGQSYREIISHIHVHKLNVKLSLSICVYDLISLR